MDYSQLTEQTFLGITSFKWAVLAGGLITLYFLRGITVWVCLMIKKNQARFSERSFLYFFFKQKIEKPLSWVIISTLGFALLEYTGLPVAFTSYLFIGIKAFLTFNVIRLCYMAAEAFGESMIEWAQHTENHFDDQLAPFASRSLKVMVIIVGVLVGLQNFGVNVTALLAGLGIGGIALAFAAQDTVANVFGTITIIMDRPFKLGDHIKIGETEGTIEEVGFRSTRIRTFYNSVVSIPNSVMAKERIDNMSERKGWIRFKQTLGFTYDSSLEQLNSYCEHIRYYLVQDQMVDRERITVNLNSFGDSSLNVLIIFHYQLAPEESDFDRINNYLDYFYKSAADKKLSFAFPTRTLIINPSTTAPVQGALNEPQQS